MQEFEHITLFNGPLKFSAIAKGEGPLVLCLHGFPDNARSYRYQLPALADAGYRVVSTTLRGYEPSSQPKDQSYKLGDVAGDVIAFLDQLGVEKYCMHISTTRTLRPTPCGPHPNGECGWVAKTGMEGYF